MTPQFAKLMMMTTSDNDQEALTAIRKANRILKMAQVTWDDMLKALYASAAPPPRPEPEWQNVNATEQRATGKKRYTNEKEINSFFDRIFARDMSGDFEEFAMSVHLWWKDKGFLTERQYNAIKKSAEVRD
jgi:hypothetical protein